MKSDKRLSKAGNIILMLLKSNEYTTPYTLRIKLHCTEREARSELEVVKQYYPVCNFMDGKGFFLARNKSDAERQRKQEIGRAKKIMYNLRGLKRYIDGGK